MTKPIRYIMVGGFLGAGKTTLLSQLAKHYQEKGHRIAIVTNDQAEDLVDTNMLRSQGFDVGEVAGACFCCHFEDLISTMEKLSEEERPEIILAEPVGSCTDLVATVIQPLKQLFNMEFTIAPYSVILKPSHGSRVLKNEKGTGFSPKAAYILEKQIEEADAVLINRADELSPEKIQELTKLIEKKVPSTPVFAISARSGLGLENLVEFLSQDGSFGQKILDIDYDIYAEGEAELGWLNSSLRVSSKSEFLLDELLLEVVQKLQATLIEANNEPAHLKTIGLWEGFFGVANLISSDSKAELSLPSHQTVKEIDLIVNARVACDPVDLEKFVKATLDQIAQVRNLAIEYRQTQSFRPGRPVPTHRMTAK